MKAIFCYKDILEVVRDGVMVLKSDATEAQRTTNRNQKKKDLKLFF